MQGRAYTPFIPESHEWSSQKFARRPQRALEQQIMPANGEGHGRREATFIDNRSMA
jgi:hypothetical protein